MSDPSELQDRSSDQVRRGHTLWVVQISSVVQRCSGACPHRGARILGNEIDAQPGNHGTCVVLVQTVEREAVVEQRRRFVEHLARQLEVHVGPRPGYRVRGGQELIQQWA
jgi:hypothetical protein